MNVKKILSWAAVIFLGYYVLTQPVAAAATWHTIAAWFQTAANSASTFLRSLSGG